MIITRTTPLGHLAEFMGPLATNENTQRMRDVLLEAGVADTDAVSDEQWLRLIDIACRD